MKLDYGVAHIEVNAGTGERKVVGTAEVIGVISGTLAFWKAMREGMVDGDLLNLDTAGEYVYRRIGPSAHTPDVIRYKRVRKALSKGET